MKIVTGAVSRCCTALLMMEVNWEDIDVRRNNSVLIMMYRIVNDDALAGLTSIFKGITQGNNFQNYNLRN